MDSQNKNNKLNNKIVIILSVIISLFLILMAVAFVKIQIHKSQQSSLDKVVASLQNPTLTNENGSMATLVFPAVPEEYQIVLEGCDYEQLVKPDGTVYLPLSEKKVLVSFRVAYQKLNAVSKEFEIQLPAEQTTQTVTNANKKPNVIPELAEWKGATGSFTISDTPTLYYNAKDYSILEDTLTLFSEDYKDITGDSLKLIAEDNPVLQPGDMQFELTDDLLYLGDEGYSCSISNKITISSSDKQGIFWGTRSILQILKQTDTTVPCGFIRDYPKYEVRGFGIDVGRKTISMGMLQNIAKTMSWYKLNDLQIHLNDNAILPYTGLTSSMDQAFTAYSGFRLESSIANNNGDTLTSTDMYYSKEEFKDFIQECRQIGINVVPEIDTPAHSLSITKIFPEYALKDSPESIDHIDLSKDKTQQLVMDIWDEYLQGENPVFDKETTLHIGLDEYYSYGELYRKYANKLISHIDKTGQDIRLWGSLSNMKGSTVIPNDNITLNIWSTLWAIPTEMYEQGYSFINTLGANLYIIPGGGYDYLDAKNLYNNFTPNVFQEKEDVYTIPSSSPQVKGASYFLWNDLCGNLAIGLSEYDLFDRFYQPLAVFSEKTWSDGSQKSYEELQSLFAKTGNAPSSDPFYRDTIKEDSIVSYPLENENNLLELKQASITTGKIGMGLTLQGGSSYATTQHRLLGLDQTISFWVKRDGDAIDSEQTLFEYKTPFYSYEFKALQKDTYEVGFSREGYDFSFGYQLPQNEWVKLTIETKKDTTTLYVNDVLTSTIGSSEPWQIHATLLFPMATIGSSEHSFIGTIDEITIAPTH